MSSFLYIETAGGGGSVTITKTDSGTANGGTYSFGTADSTRLVLAAISNAAGVGRVITGVTIGGVAATLVCSVNLGGAAAGDWAALYIAAVPTGTSGVVTVSFNGAITAFGVTVYSIINAASATPAHTGTATNSLTITVPSNGVVVGVTTNVVAAGSTITWSAGITEDTDFNAGSGTVQSSAASQAYATGQSLTVTATPTSSTAQGLAVASFA